MTDLGKLISEKESELEHFKSVAEYACYDAFGDGGDEESRHAYYDEYVEYSDLARRTEEQIVCLKRQLALSK